MSVVASPAPLPPFSDNELFSHSGSVSAQAELPPPLPLPVPQPTVPFPSFQHRHTSPYPMPHSFSALGPPPPADRPNNVLNAITPPLAPKGSPVTLPTVTPDVLPQTPLPPTPDSSPPGSKLLSPAMMVKLAPPADDSPYEIWPTLSDATSLPGPSIDATPRRLPAITVDIPQVPFTSPSQQTPPARTTASSALEAASSSAPPKIATEMKPTRTKSTGPPPRPRRSQTAHPYPHPTAVRMSESRSADSRAKLRANAAAMMPRTASYGPMQSPNLTRAMTEAGSTPSRAGLVVPTDMAPPDLGGPDGLEAKVVLLGSQGVGKTSLILRYTTRVFSPTPAPATIGSSLHTRKLVHSGVRVKLQIWDTAGQERFRSMAPIYYRGAHVCVLVYDISDRQSFEDVRSWLEELGRTVPKETVIFVVGAKIDLERKRAIKFDEAREIIRSWIKPAPPPVPPPLLTPPHRSLFRSSTSVSRTDSPTSHTPSRSQSFGALSNFETTTPRSATNVPLPKSSEASRPGSTVPFPVTNPSPSRSAAKSVPIKAAPRPPPTIKILSPKSPTMRAFPTLQSPTKATSATFTEPIAPSITPAASMSGHRVSGGRFSISGVLGLNRTTSMSGAVSSLHQIAEGPASPRPADGPSAQSDISPPPTRVRVESSPLLSSYEPRNNRRRSEDWSSRSWKMGEGPSAAEALGEFGDGVKKKASGEMLSGSGILKAQGGRSRGGSLGRDERLHGAITSRSSDDEAGDGLWGVEVEGVRLGECSALTGEGVEALFKSITSLLVERKDKIERDRVLRKKNSVMLVDPNKDGKGDDSEGKGKGGYGCCA
ncbi:hypothetical protein CI109_106003 [Kwoniella shandongensis]|uniref:Uncharacterized protein n=1 Tax=Kwoniella shandongensis TaxID=1734106 RepID=A0A5M6BZM3_9TREE|nr:uncharacterized protein CI109_003949 [Kwoniella shandongensis]KAA5527690.1 hypothetical protein CI109_003949 [Kwoniella shandongensis]